MQEDVFGGDFAGGNAARRSGFFELIDLIELNNACDYLCFMLLLVLRMWFCLLGNKRSFGDLDDDEDDIFGSKKVPFTPVTALEVRNFYCISSYLLHYAVALCSFSSRVHRCSFELSFLLAS